MDRKSSTLIFLFLVGILNIGNSQNCYESIMDLSGIDITPFQSDLESAACDLTAAFPTEFQDSFKVFDIGFYSLDEFKEGGFESSWNKVINLANSKSKYYLLLGRQFPSSDGQIKIWVEIKLPETSWLNLCYNSTYIEVIKLNIKNEINKILESYDRATSFPQVEIEGMEFVSTLIQELSDCCQPSLNFRSDPQSCDNCITYADVYAQLIDKNFSPHFSCEILNSTSDPLCLCLPEEIAVNRRRSKIRSSETIIDSAQLSIEIEGIQYNLKNVLEQASVEIPNLRGFITKNENFCNPDLFSQLQEVYNNSDNAAWIHIWENGEIQGNDIILLKYKLNSIPNASSVFDAFTNSDFDVQPSYKFKITQRSFAPWDRFGHLPILPGVHIAKNSFHGDNRGFSLNNSTVLLNDENDVSARLHQYLEFDLNSNIIDRARFSSLTVGYRNFVRKSPATHLEPEKLLSEQTSQQNPTGYEELEKNGINSKITMFVQGSDPLVTPVFPGVSWFTPDIECLLYINSYYNQENSSLYIHGSIFYKEFPAYECFIEDNCEKKVFLHTMTAPCESSLASELMNPGYDYHRFFDFRIPLNDEGCFLDEIIELNINRVSNYIQDGENFTINEWNEFNLSKKAAIDCPISPCEGAYPNNGMNLREFYNCDE